MVTSEPEPSQEMPRMRKRLSVAILTLLCVCGAPGGEKQIVSLRNFCGEELKSAGIELHQPARVHIIALGGGGDKGWTGGRRRFLGAVG